MGRRKKKKHYKQYKSVQALASPQNPVPTLSLENDPDIQVPTTPVVSEVKKIAIIMTLLVLVLAIVAFTNTKTDWIDSAGRWLMNALHIYGA